MALQSPKHSRESKISRIRDLSLSNREKIDPAGILGLQNRFIGRMNKKFSDLQWAIRQAIVVKDCFGLRSGGLSLLARSPELEQVVARLQNRAFNFPRPQEKISHFMAWLKDAERADILKIVRMPGFMGEATEKAWTDTFIQSAYQKGIITARRDLRREGRTDIPAISGTGEAGISSVFNQPFHIDRVGLIYSRAYNELKGVTEFMNQQISRTLAEAIAEGRNPREMARMLQKNVTGLAPSKSQALVRARAIARTETIRAHHSARVQEFRNAGVEGVKIKVEWHAAFEPCPLCADLDGEIFTLDEVENMIPAHPNCRCVALPKLQIDKGTKERIRGNTIYINFKGNWPNWMKEAI